MKCYIPDKIDLDSLIAKYPPEEVLKFNKDKLVCILDEVTKGEADADGFVEKYSKLFQKGIHNYSSYLEYAERIKILEIRKQFQHNQIASYSRGYKFNPDYNSTVTGYDINYFTLVKNIQKAKIRKNICPPGYKHLTKWFNSKLTINKDLALNYLNFELQLYKEEYSLKKKRFEVINNTWFDDYSEKKMLLEKNKPSEPYRKYNSRFMAIDKINDRDFSTSVDSTIHRFHSNITSLPSDYRNFLEYDGNELVAVDIKNCQPYLLLKLLNQDFWININKTNPKSPYSNPLIQISQSSSSSSPSLILAESLLSIDIQEVKAYSDLVISGEIYDYLAKTIEHHTGKVFSDRREIKDVFFKIMFSGNQFIGQKEAKPKRIFKSKFPTIYSFLNEIKKINRKGLSILLQQMEANLVLKGITKRIAKENPGLPIFTIHDSIITIKGYEKYLLEVMNEELASYIGAKPQLHVESYRINQLKNYEKWKNN